MAVEDDFWGYMDLGFNKNIDLFFWFASFFRVRIFFVWFGTFCSYTSYFFDIFALKGNKIYYSCKLLTWKSKFYGYIDFWFNNSSEKAVTLSWCAANSNAFAAKLFLFDIFHWKNQWKLSQIKMIPVVVRTLVVYNHIH